MESKKDGLLFPKLQLANSNMQLKKIKVDHCKVRRKLKCNFETVSHSLKKIFTLFIVLKNYLLI